jgi:hypothetical protein
MDVTVKLRPQEPEEEQEPAGQEQGQGQPPPQQQQQQQMAVRPTGAAQQPVEQVRVEGVVSAGIAPCYKKNHWLITQQALQSDMTIAPHGGFLAAWA